MEYMMIRSVKSAAAGTSGSDLQKSTLGLVSGGGTASNHHNNLYQQHHLGNNTFVQQQQQQTVGGGGGYINVGGGVGLTSQQTIQQQYQSNPYLQSNSYGINLYSQQLLQTTTSGDTLSWNLDNSGLFSTIATPTSAIPDAFSPLSSQTLSKKKTPTLLPIVIKSKDTLDRISNSGSMQQNCFSSYLGVESSNNNAFNCRSLNDFGDQSKGQLNSRKDFSSAPESANRPNTAAKKMSKLLWESSHQKPNNFPCNGFTFDTPSSEDTEKVKPIVRKRKPANEHKFSVSSFYCNDTSYNSKKQKLEQKSTLRMPNLLKSVTNNGKKVFSDTLTKSSDNLYVDSFKTPSTSVTPVTRSGPPIDNVFLKKYDPIRLLKRLRCNAYRKTVTAAIVKSVVAPKKKKVVLFNDFPDAISQRHLELQNPTQVVRKKRRKRKPAEPQANLYSWTPQGGIQVIKDQSKKRRRKAVALPKHCTPKRKVHVKYRTPYVGKRLYSPLSEDRLRIIAAVYLRRAVKRLRCSGKIDKAVIQHRLKKLKSRRKRNRARASKHLTQKDNSYKANLAAGQRSGPLSRFCVTNSKLPRPIPIETRSSSLAENPFLLHTLELLRHKRELQDRLEAIESDGTVQKVGPLPEKPHSGTRVPLLSENIPLKRRQVKHVISQKLLICLSTVGFTHTKLRPLEVMADATSNFLTKMAQRLKEVSEMEMHGAEHGFPDAMERVLCEQGFGGIRGIEEFYRTKVIDYGQRMEDQCLLLRRQYAYKVRSKVGMMSSNVSTTITSNNSAPSLSSSSSVTTISATSSSTTCNNVNSTPSHAPPTVMVVSTGNGGNNSAATGVAGKSTLMAKTSSSSSQPLSPGNSVLAEMLSSQEDLAARTPQTCPSSPSLGMMMGSNGPMERQLEELMGAPPPNVEIRPNSFPHPHHPHHQQHRQANLSQQQQQQQVPLQHLLASLSQQQQSPQSRQQQQHQSQSLLPPPSPQQQQQQQQQSLNPYGNSHYQYVASSPPLTPPTPPHHLNQKLYQHQQHQQQQSQQPSLQGTSQQGQQQSQLTQLLQRPITSQQGPTATAMVTTPHTHTATASSGQHHLILHHHHPQQQQQGAPPPQQANQYHHQLHGSHLTSSNQQPQHTTNPVRNTNINTITTAAVAAATTKNSPHHHHPPSQASHHPPGQPAPIQGQVSRQLVSAPPHQLNLSKAPGQLSSHPSGEITYSSNITTPSRTSIISSNGIASPSNPSSMQGAGAGGGGKLITIIRSSSSTGTTPQQQGIIVNSNHRHNYQDSSATTGGVQDNVISINLGGHSDIDTGGSIGNSPTASCTSSSASKAKLKEAISQRNLLRLNFEQVPSGAGDSTVLLSSSSVVASSAPSPASNNANNSVQFIGKVTGSGVGGGQAVQWNNTTNYS